MASFLKDRGSQRNIRLLLRFLTVLVLLVCLFTVLFHVLMEREGQEHSWLTGFYWTLTVMSTLGFGDITFSSDLGRLFSVFVLLSGMIFLLVLLPFTFIEFFYAPWMEAQSAARAPRELPESVRGHVIITHENPVTTALVHKLKQYNYPYVMVVADLDKALRLHDQGINVVVGDQDKPDTYQRVRIKQAALVSATGTDAMNTNIAFTVRELSDAVPVSTTASAEAAADVLRLAGSAHVVRLDELMGQSLARRTIGGDAVAHIIGQFDKLLIAEATATGTPLVGKTIAESRLREMIGVTIIGVWERGRFDVAKPDTPITATTVLVLAGSSEQLHKYDELFCIYHVTESPAIIIGGGRVGRATGRALQERNLDFCIIEKLAARVRSGKARYMIGDAAEFETLEKAGLMQAPSVIITTHDDDTNIYLTLYCRKLRPDIQIISRATLERNVSTLHRAGADFVMSYSSMGANIIFNLLKRSDILMLAEGLNVFKMKIPESLVGKTLAESAIREQTSCSVIALQKKEELLINPDPKIPFEADTYIILIGSFEAENQFLKLYGKAG